jgi:2-desacetyl-2-hydroxyethyl bacteriochlorophyllide A dehydrogenase
MKVNRIIFAARDQVATETVELDMTPGPHQVLIKTQLTMVSQGTELAGLRGTHTRSNIPNPPAWLCYPSVPGYLQVGTVEAVGKDVTGYAVGDRVIGEGGGCWNSHASHLLCGDDPRWLVKVPKGVSDQAAVITKMGSIALHGVRTTEPVIGQSCAVIGLGVIGQLVSRLAVLSGMRVVATDIVPSRRAMAAKAPNLTVVAPEDLAAGDPDGYEHVIEASGSAKGFQVACQIARRLAKVAIISAPHMPVEVRLYEHIVNKSLHIMGAHGSATTGDVTCLDRWTERRQKEFYLRMVAEGRLDPLPLITSTQPWTDAPKVYKALIDNPAEHVGVVFTWN